MKKIFIIIMLICLISTKGFSDDSIASFFDGENKITLKMTDSRKEYGYERFFFSYIIDIKINTIEDDLGIYICLNDKDGFQIDNKIFHGNVSANFLGKLKGHFCIDLKDDQKICGAELYYVNNE